MKKKLPKDGNKYIIYTPEFIKTAIFIAAKNVFLVCGTGETITLEKVKRFSQVSTYVI